MTSSNCMEQLSVADIGIVGSYLKEGHIDSGDMSFSNTTEFMKKIKELRYEVIK